MNTTRAAAAATVSLAVLACGHASTGPNPSTTGSLVITVQAVANTTTSIVVSGPSGDTNVVTGTDTLRGLAVGTYAIASAGAQAPASIVNVFYAGIVTGSPVTISAGDTGRISIRFAPRPGSGALWVASTGGGHPVAVDYPAAQLTTTGTAGPSLSVAGAYAAFDAAGNLWVGDSSANTISGYGSRQLATSGAPPVSVTITSAALQGPTGLAFDRAGNLWVSNYAGNTVVEFTPRQLASSGSRTPAIVLGGVALDGPSRIAFDSTGNLWLSNSLSNTVVALGDSSLTTSGSPLPAITLTSANGSLAGPSGLAFDNAGDLWVANTAGNTIVAFQPSQIAASGGATPYETVFLPTADGAPTALAFDNAGDLWTTSASGAAVLEYTTAQLAAGDTVPPALVLGVASAPTTLAFDPPPDSVPLFGSLLARRPRVTGRKM